MKYLITGATGNLGGGILKYLSNSVDKKDIAVFVRSEEKGKRFAEEGYDVRIGDFAIKDSLDKAFAGIDTLMFVSSGPSDLAPRDVQHTNVVTAAKEAGVKNIVYTSIAKASESDSFLAADHKLTEELIENSGLNYKIVRNNWYLENEVATMQGAISGAPFAHAAGEHTVGWALRREYAEAAANALMGDFSDSAIYELSGKALTYNDLAAALKEYSGKDFDVLSLSADDFKASLEAAGMPEEVIAYLSVIQSTIAEGILEVENSDLETLLGHPQLSTVEAIKELLG